MKSLWPDMTPSEFDALLQSGALSDDLGSSGRDTSYGYGLINARKAVLAAQEQGGGSATLPPVLAATPSSLNFGQTQEQLTVTLQNSGQGSLVVTGVADDAAWLEVAAGSVDSSALGEYQVSVDRSALAAGTYSATITVSSTANELSIPVIMSVGAAGGSSSDAGHHYVLLVDADSLDVVDQVEVDVVDGRYAYSFSGVEGGSYKLFAGTDLDDDGWLGDGGEAAGGYPTRDQLLTVEVTGDLSLLDSLW